jgi:hypothetical protein
LLCGDFNSGWDPKSGINPHFGFIAQFMLEAWAPVDVLFADREILYCGLAAGDFATFWVGSTVGWNQSDGKVNLDVAGTGTI